MDNNKKNNDFLNKLINGLPIEDSDLVSAPVPTNMEQPVSIAPINQQVSASQSMQQIQPQSSQALPQSIQSEPQQSTSQLDQLLKIYQSEKMDYGKQQKLDEENRKKAIILNMIKGMTQGAMKIGQGIAGRYSGKFDVNTADMDNTFKGYTDALSSNKEKTENRLKDLLDIYRLKQTDEKIEALYNLEGGRQGRFNRSQGFKETEKEQTQQENILKDFNRDEIVKLANKAMSDGTTARDLLNSKNPQDHRTAPRFIARAIEKGVLTDADVAEYGGSKAVLDRFNQGLETMTTGLFTEDNQKYLLGLVDKLERAGKRNKLQRAWDLNKKYSQSSDIDVDTVNELIAPEINQMDEKTRQLIDWALKNSRNPKAMEVLKKLGY